MKITIKTNQRLFFVAYVIYNIALFMEVINLDIQIAAVIKKILVLLSMGVLAANFLTYPPAYIIKRNRNLFLALSGAAIYLLIIILSIRTSNYFLIVVILFSLNLRNIEIDDLLKMAMYSIVMVTLAVVALSVVNILPNVQSVRNTISHYGRVRNSFGFTGSQIIPNIIVYIAAYCFSIQEKISWGKMIGFQILGLIVYCFCDSRNGMIALEVLIILQIMGRCMNSKTRKKKMIFLMGSSSYLVIGLFSWVILQEYRHGNHFAKLLNTLISGRLQWTLENMWANPFRLINWSSHMEFTQLLRYAYDNGYFYLIARYGYIFFIAFLAITVVVAVHMKNSNKYGALISFAVIALLNFIDNGFISYGFFPYFILGMHCLIAGTESKRQME